MDSLTHSERSRHMARIRSRDTRPEMIVRRLLHSMGYRYRLHSRKLPGTPDIVFARRKKLVFVHGCFWHQHSGCNGGRIPKSRQEFWSLKFDINVKRDQRNQDALRALGWDVLVVWECEVRDQTTLRERLRDFLESDKSNH